MRLRLVNITKQLYRCKIPAHPYKSYPKLFAHSLEWALKMRNNANLACEIFFYSGKFLQTKKNF